MKAVLCNHFHLRVSFDLFKGHCVFPEVEVCVFAEEFLTDVLFSGAGGEFLTDVLFFGARSVQLRVHKYIMKKLKN